MAAPFETVLEKKGHCMREGNTLRITPEGAKYLKAAKPPEFPKLGRIAFIPYGTDEHILL